MQLIFLLMKSTVPRTLYFYPTLNQGSLFRTRGSFISWDKVSEPIHTESAALPGLSQNSHV